MLPTSVKLKVDARHFPLGCLISLVTLSVLPSIQIQASPVNKSMRGLMKDYCISCHNPDQKKGKLDLESILEVDMAQHFEIWDEVSWMLEEREMPPEDAPDEPRPTDAEYEQGAQWLADALKGLAPEGHSAIAISSKLAVVDKYCISCHNAEENKGDMNLEDIRFDDVLEHSEIWENVITRLKSRQMPPSDRKRPTEETYEAVLANLTETLDAAAIENPNPGRTDTFRRLNRTEYQNSIRDLLGVEIDAGTLLPKDEESHGFDNITVGTLSPSLLDRYISAAQKISRLAVGAPNDILSGDTFRTPADHTQESM
jgi:mono/diheme cytochrome c family protein